MENKVTEIAVLTFEQYKALEKQVAGSTVVTHQTTEIQAGYQLGVQSVLSILRNGFVSGAR